jgi:hypothetical protein
MEGAQIVPGFWKGGAKLQGPYEIGVGAFVFSQVPETHGQLMLNVGVFRIHLGRIEQMLDPRARLALLDERAAKVCPGSGFFAFSLTPGGATHAERQNNDKNE